MVETVSFRAFLEANWGTYGYGYLRWPGVEVTDETGKLPRYVSTVLSFAPHLVGNGFIRSVCYGFVGTYRSGNRKKRIGTSVNAPLKNAPLKCLPLRSLRGRCHLW